ncbi:MAG: anti-sigma factor family protein [Planctomycetota bacterium]|jgi:hypothetical protein
MTDDLNIDELLNGYIDDELDRRQQVELKRLVDNDPVLAERLNQLKRCKMMVNALPRIQAPPNMLRDIKLQLERKTPIEEPIPFATRTKTEGTRQVFYRKLLKTAAMIALLAGLTGVIYTIVGPSDTTQKTIVDKSLQPPVQVTQETPEKITEATIVKEIPAEGTFNGKIILTTQNLLPLDAFINRGIVELGLLSRTKLDSEKNRSVFDINCSHGELEKLLAQLSTIWQKCDSKTLQLYTQQFPDQISVQNVHPQQIIQMSKLSSIDEQIKVAQEYSALNNIKASLPSQTLFANFDAERQFSFSIPKPVLTSAQPTPIDKATDQKEPQNVHLTIVIQDSK